MSSEGEGRGIFLRNLMFAFCELFYQSCKENQIIPFFIPVQQHWQERGGDIGKTIIPSCQLDRYNIILRKCRKEPQTKPTTSQHPHPPRRVYFGTYSKSPLWITTGKLPSLPQQAKHKSLCFKAQILAVIGVGAQPALQSARLLKEQLKRHV